jgi:hypothetical protein
MMAQNVIVGALVIAAGMCAYPPFVVAWEGKRVSRGYHFFFNPPSAVCQVDLLRIPRDGDQRSELMSITIPK